jgi:hypothetical protein
LSLIISPTFWSTDRLWYFIGVPFEVATKAIDVVVGEFRERLKDGLRLLPGSNG